MAYIPPNVTSPDGLFVYISQNEPGIIPIFLAAFWFIFTLVGFTARKMKVGTADFFAMMSVGGILVLFMELIMRTIGGVISDYVLWTTIVIEAVSVLFYYFNQERG